MSTKQCPRCNRAFPLSDEFWYFKKSGRQKGQPQPRCKTCMNKLSKEQTKSGAKIITSKAFRKRNPEYSTQYARKYREVNRERYNGYCRRYAQKTGYRKTAAFRAIVHISQSRRRARKLSLPDTFTTQEWLNCLEYFNHCCAVCGSQLRDLFGDTVPHADHWIPLASEECTGTVVTNMICLCNHCNLSKSATMPQEWLLRHYSYKKANQILGRIETYFDSVRRYLTIEKSPFHSYIFIRARK